MTGHHARADEPDPYAPRSCHEPAPFVLSHATFLAELRRIFTTSLTGGPPRSIGVPIKQKYERSYPASPQASARRKRLTAKNQSTDRIATSSSAKSHGAGRCQPTNSAAAAPSPSRDR
jgi:hypothetical protein